VAVVLYLFVCVWTRQLFGDSEQAHNVLVSLDLFPIILTTATWLKLAKNVFGLWVFFFFRMEAKILNELVISHVNLDEIDLLVLLLFD
jgi:hypothetical protein